MKWDVQTVVSLLPRNIYIIKPVVLVLFTAWRLLYEMSYSYILVYRIFERFVAVSKEKI